MLIHRKNKIYSGVALAILLNSDVIASRLDIVNENKKELTVKVRADGDETTEKLTTHIKKIPAELPSTLVISKSDINNKTYFSIKGDTSPFTQGGKCDYLNVEKNYQVTFLNDTAGTTCIAEEIK